MRAWITITCLAMACGAFAQQTQATSSSSVGVTVDVNYEEMYLFRGRVLDPDSAFQGQLTIGISSWNYNLFHHAGKDSASEVELFEPFEEFTHSFEYTTLRGNAVSTMGYRFYDYSEMWPDTQELFFRIAHQTPWHPSYGVAYDFDAYRGSYFDFSLTRRFPVSRRSSLSFDFDIGLSTGMEEKGNRQGQILEYGPYSEELNHGSLELDYLWSITPKLSVHAGYTYHHAFDDKLRDDALTGEHNDTFSAGFKLILP